MTLTELADRLGELRQEANKTRRAYETKEAIREEIGEELIDALPLLVAALRELDDRRSRQEPDDVTCIAAKDRTNRELAKLEAR